MASLRKQRRGESPEEKFGKKSTMSLDDPTLIMRTPDILPLCIYIYIYTYIYIELKCIRGVALGGVIGWSTSGEKPFRVLSPLSR